jgi:hypothetical protein
MHVLSGDAHDAFAGMLTGRWQANGGAMTTSTPSMLPKTGRKVLKKSAVSDGVLNIFQLAATMGLRGLDISAMDLDKQFLGHCK